MDEPVDEAYPHGTSLSEGGIEDATPHTSNHDSNDGKCQQLMELYIVPTLTENYSGLDEKEEHASRFVNKCKSEEKKRIGPAASSNLDVSCVER